MLKRILLAVGILKRVLRRQWRPALRRRHSPLGVLVRVLLCLFLWCPQAQAVEVSGLLAVEVPVADRTPEDQKVAMQEALRWVLQRLSGRTDIGTSSALSKAFADPAKFATRLGIVETDKGDVLRVAFDRSAMVNLLAQSNLPVWSTNRQLTVLWIALNDGFASDWIAAGAENDLVRSFTEQGRARGVPLVFPIMDFDDSTAVSVTDLAGGFPGNFLKASQRYDGEVALTGVVQESLSGAYTAQWMVIDARGKLEFALEARDANDMVSQVFGRLIPILSGQRRLSGGLGEDPSGGTYRILVDGIDSVRAYAETLAALNRAPGVDFVRLEVFDRQQLSFRLRSSLPFEELVPALTATGSLQAEAGDAFGLGTEQTVRLRWWPATAPVGP